MSILEVIMLVLSVDGFMVTIFAFVMTNSEPGSTMGLRFPATLDDDRVWRETNQHGGIRLQWLGIAILVGGIALIFSSVDEVVAFVLHLGLQIAAFAWVLVDASRFSERRLAHYRAMEGEAQGPQRPSEG